MIFGTEDDDDVRWVYLSDCKHTFESSGLENWLNVKQEGNEIIYKRCPRCSTPIVTVQRFMKLIKLTNQDIQNVKKKCFGKLEEIKKLRHQALKQIQDIDFERMTVPGMSDVDELEGLYHILRTELPDVKGQMKKRNVIDLQKTQLLCFCTEFFVSLYERKHSAWNQLNYEKQLLLTKKINHLTQLLKQREKKITEEEMKSFERELKRIHRLCDLFIYQCSVQFRMASSDAQVAAEQAERAINRIAVYDDKLDDEIKVYLNYIKLLIKSSTEVSDAERAMIHKAMSSSFHSSQKTGHWFKCKNGHLYCITECGGAMEEAVCPVRGCGERIGGGHHALRADQQLAGEMDGASYAAWSDANNMANYGQM